VDLELRFATAIRGVEIDQPLHVAEFGLELVRNFHQLLHVVAAHVELNRLLTETATATDGTDRLSRYQDVG
jgi:hypothetical protein